MLDYVQKLIISSSM